MIFHQKDNAEAFRIAVRDWLGRTLPPDWQARADEDSVGFQRWWMGEMRCAGIATPHWPAEYGGADLDLAHQVIIADEMARANAPAVGMYIVSLTHVPATLLAWGDAAQKAAYLPGISKQGDVWCQGFSEPGAGSDLASLRTRAVRSGDEYIINGQKVWSSYAMHARYCILLARTDPGTKKHAGISYFVMDMQAPGVEVRPIRQATGDSEFCELFLTDVRVPVRDRIGAEGQGWQVAQATLAAERGVYGFEVAERLRYSFEIFHREGVQTGAEWLKDDQLRREFVSLFGQMQALRRLTRQLLRENHQEQPIASMTPAYVKLVGTELQQKFADLRVRVAGIHAQPLRRHGPLFDYIESFGLTISGGTNEIMRNIIAERGLGMPR